MTKKEIEIKKYNYQQHNNWWSLICKELTKGILIDDAIKIVGKPIYKPY